MIPSLAEHYRQILVGVIENPEREGLLDTPRPAAKAMQYLCNGLAASAITVWAAGMPVAPPMPRSTC
jgi:GTP cyclohydrolase I